MSSRILIGIDPGKSGGACIYAYATDLFDHMKSLFGHLEKIANLSVEASAYHHIIFIDWPKNDNEILITEAFREIRMWRRRFLNDTKKVIEITVLLEKVSAMPKQGVVSMFRFGANFGFWRGLLAALDFPRIEITPKEWQKGVITKTDGADPKSRSLKVASRLIGKEATKLLYGSRGGAKDGRADAFLMAYVASLRGKNNDN